MAENYLRPEQYNFAPKILGAVLHDAGLIVVLRQGLYSQRLTQSSIDLDIRAAHHIAQLEDQHEVDGVVISGERNSVLVSAGESLGRMWMLAWLDRPGMDARSPTLRAQATDNMRRWLRAGAALDPDISVAVDGTVRDPLLIEALRLTFAVTVAKKRRAAMGRYSLLKEDETEQPAYNANIGDYDPLADV